jgi:hypothetical protein
MFDWKLDPKTGGLLGVFAWHFCLVLFA